MFFPEPENVFETKKERFFFLQIIPIISQIIHFFHRSSIYFFIDKNWREKFFFSEKKIIAQPHPLIVKWSFSTTKKACIYTHHLYCLGKGGMVITKCFYAIQIQSYYLIKFINNANFSKFMYTDYLPKRFFFSVTRRPAATEVLSAVFR